MRLNLVAAASLALIFIVVRVPRVSAVMPTCPEFTNCGVAWNIESRNQQQCCKGIATVHGCRSGHGSAMACWCNSYISDACSAHRSQCPEIPVVKSQRRTNVAQGNSDVSQMKNQVGTLGLNANYFFNNFLMKAYEKAYQHDAYNLNLFQNLMSEHNPPAPSFALGNFLFNIFKDLISLLPGVGEGIDAWSLIGTAIGITDSSITLATNTKGGQYQENIAWREFLMTQALGYSQAESELRVGLWNWLEKFWSKSKFPKLIKDPSSKASRTLGALINKLWSKMQTQQESFLSFIASYFNGVGAGIMAKCETGNRQGLWWTITQVPNNQILMQHLMKYTGNCIDANNFRDFNGKPVTMAQIGSVCSKGSMRTHCNSGIILGGKNLAITSQFKQEKSSTSLNPNLCYHKDGKKFPITYTGTHGHSFNVASSNPTTDTNTLTLPLAVGGSVLGVVLIAVVVVVVVVVRRPGKGVEYAVEEQSKLSLESGSADYKTETGEDP